MMAFRFRVLIFLSVVLFFAFAGPAFAFNESTTTVDWGNCNSCHSPGTMTGTGTRFGPHGGYTSTTSACDSCHSVHDATTSFKLLPGATVFATCMTCHDGTTTIGQGVYGAIQGRGLNVASRHRIESTSSVPGGSAANGGAETRAFSGPGSTLTCSDCHSPHGNACVDPFYGERQRSSAWGTLTLQTQNRLLKRRPTSSVTTSTVYGSDWCLSCHSGRNSGMPAVHNHPVESASTYATESARFHYNRVARLNAGANATATTLGTLGANNGGYLMPYPRTSQQAGHKPICQQCHEDARNPGSLNATGNAGTVTPYNVTSADGFVAGSNPRFQNFPHETTNYRMLVEATATVYYDDLCLNCHPVAQLP